MHFILYIISMPTKSIVLIAYTIGMKMSVSCLKSANVIPLDIEYILEQSYQLKMKMCLLLESAFSNFNFNHGTR